MTKKLRDAMIAEDDDDSSGIFAIYDEVPAGQWANGGKILDLSELLREMGGEMETMRKCAEACRRCAKTCREVAKSGPVRRAA